MRWLRLLRAVGSHSTLVLSPLGNWYFLYCCGFYIAFSALPSPTTVGASGVYAWRGVYFIPDPPHFVEWHIEAQYGNELTSGLSFFVTMGPLYCFSSVCSLVEWNCHRGLCSRYHLLRTLCAAQCAKHLKCICLPNLQKNPVGQR